MSNQAEEMLNATIDAIDAVRHAALLEHLAGKADDLAYVPDSGNIRRVYGHLGYADINVDEKTIGDPDEEGVVTWDDDDTFEVIAGGGPIATGWIEGLAAALGQ